MRAPAPAEVLGVVLAGGRSSRYGSDKAFAHLGGVSLVERAARALNSVARRVVVVANDAEGHAETAWPVRPDLVTGIGPLGGLHTAVAWAAEEGHTGVIVLATDMPLVPSSLLGELAARLEGGGAVVPASGGPRGIEPLCAAYHVDCLPAIETAIERGERAVISFFPLVAVRVVSLAEVSQHGDPDTIFFNVNRPEDHLRAGELLAALQPADGAAEQE